MSTKPVITFAVSPSGDDVKVTVGKKGLGTGCTDFTKNIEEILGKAKEATREFTEEYVEADACTLELDN